jgi:hypothetical protein
MRDSGRSRAIISFCDLAGGGSGGAFELSAGVGGSGGSVFSVSAAGSGGDGGETGVERHAATIRVTMQKKKIFVQHLRVVFIMQSRNLLQSKHFAFCPDTPQPVCRVKL